MINIVIPMAGRGSRFADAGYLDPKPLIRLGGRPMISWVIENLRPVVEHRFIFICLSEHLERYPDVRKTLETLCPGCGIVEVSAVTEGAACTVLLARELINNDEPLMIANSDQYIDFDVNGYLEAALNPSVDGLIMTFEDNDPKWSYCLMRADGFVGSVVEKQVVSDKATTGVYNYSRGQDFVRAAEAMIRDDIRVNGEFYVAPAYDQMIAGGANVAIYHLSPGSMYGIGTPQDLHAFMETELYVGLLTETERIRYRTEAYVRAFDSKDLEGVLSFFGDGFVLEDPAGSFSGEQTLREYIGGLFSNHEHLSFKAKHITVEGECSVIEFVLELNEQVLVGVDWIEWEGLRMKGLRAYLYRK